VAQLDRFQHHRGPEVQHLPPVTPPVCFGSSS
jgi:hypothetical protein